MKAHWLALGVVGMVFSGTVAHAEIKGTPAINTTNSNSSENLYRVGLRIGADTYTKPTQENNRYNNDNETSGGSYGYISGGIDLSARTEKTELTVGEIQGQLGVVASLLSSEEKAGDRYSAHLKAGPLFRVSDFVVGGQGLVGIVTTPDWGMRSDIGAELNAGIELGNISIMAGAGLTTHSLRLGLDVGTTF